MKHLTDMDLAVILDRTGDMLLPETGAHLRVCAECRARLLAARNAVKQLNVWEADALGEPSVQVDEVEEQAKRRVLDAVSASGGDRRAGRAFTRVLPLRPLTRPQAALAAANAPAPGSRLLELSTRGGEYRVTFRRGEMSAVRAYLITVEPVGPASAHLRLKEDGRVYRFSSDGIIDLDGVRDAELADCELCLEDDAQAE